MMTEDWKEAKALLDEALHLLPEEPLIVSLQGVFYALTGKEEQALDCMTRALANPKSFGTPPYLLSDRLHSCPDRRRETAFEWLERSVSSGFACWPFFQKDHCLSSLQGKYPDHLGLL
jgi:tetratricopeptide (TPR) repeat protein